MCGAEQPRDWDAVPVVVAWACEVGTFRSGLCRPLFGEGTQEISRLPSFPTLLSDLFRGSREACLTSAIAPAGLGRGLGAFMPDSCSCGPGPPSEEPHQRLPTPFRAPGHPLSVCLPC